MTTSYIILAHKNPSQLARLITRLDGEDSFFYIHIDKNVGISLFENEFRNNKNVTFLQEREHIIWGDIGIVKATLKALKKVVQNHKSGFCILMSGQDYPIKNRTALKEFLKENQDTNFIDLFAMPGTWREGGTDRIHKYKINKSPHRGHFTLLPTIFDRSFYQLETAGKINYLRKSGKYGAVLKMFIKRNFPEYLRPHGGSQWWAIPVNTIYLIFQFLEDHPDYLKYHEHTLCADEIFFHSIIAHLKEQNSLKIAPALTYTNWTRKSGPLPVTFKTRDFQELKQVKGKYFARKFDMEMDNRILDKIDQFLINP